MRSSFSQAEHDKYDLKGRNYARAIALKYGMSLEDNPDKLGIDLLVYRIKTGELIGYADAEVRPELWEGDQPKYNTIHAIQKKADDYSKLDLPAWYFSISGDGKYMLSCQFSEILKTKLIEVSNKREKKGEFFYNVPVSMWRKLSL
jgi:hypothetical protein